MEADISIWRKPGHFYFALTLADLPKIVEARRDQPDFFVEQCVHRFGIDFSDPRAIRARWKLPARERKTIGVGVIRIKA